MRQTTITITLSSILSLSVLAIGVLIFLLLHDDPQPSYQIAAAEGGSLAPSKYDEHLLMLDRTAIDSAYQDQVMRLILVWFKDDTDQPRRAINGVTIARRRYIDMMAAVDKREEDLKTLRGLQQR